MRTRKYTNHEISSGFTIIELLIASLVFSIVLVGVMMAFIQISRIFYKGLNMANTQDATSTALADIASDIQYSPATLSPFSVGAGGSNSFCIGDHRYAFFTGQQVGSASLAGIYREQESAGSCPTLSGAPVVTSQAVQLLDNGMQLNTLSLSCNGIVCHINAHVVFYGSGYSGLFASASGYSPAYQAPDAECTGALTSSQYCATADFNRSVLQRP